LWRWLHSGLQSTQQRWMKSKPQSRTHKPRAKSREKKHGRFRDRKQDHAKIKMDTEDARRRVESSSPFFAALLQAFPTEAKRIRLL